MDRVEVTHERSPPQNKRAHNRQRYYSDASELSVLWVAALLLVGIVVYTNDQEEQRRWLAFSQAYECRPSKTNAEAFDESAIGTAGYMLTSVANEPVKVQYLCSDGSTYFR